MKVNELFSEYFISDVENNLLHGSIKNDDVVVEYVDAHQFLCPERLDLVCKLYYIECRERGKGLSFAKEVYAQHIKAFSMGKYTEVWNPEKNSLEKYFQVFDTLIDDIKNNGLDAKKSVVPIGNDNIILDGAHRTAIAIYYNLKIPVARLNTRSWINNYKMFQNRGDCSVSEKYMDFIAYQYMRYKNPCYMAFIWPISYHNPNYQVALKLLEECCNVVYVKKVSLNYNGLFQLAQHAYFDSDWAGGIENNFPGIPGVVNERFAQNAPVTAVILDGMTLERVQEIKKIIRIVLGGGFCRIHITDTQEEALRMGQMILNENSVHFMNNAYALKYPAFISEFLKFRNEVQKQKAQESVCIDTGAVMGIYGLRETNDIDYLACESVEINGFDKHTQEYYNITAPSIQVEDVVYNWFNHFYCFDVMFSSLEHVKKYKAVRNETKDVRDIELIKGLKTDCPYERIYRPKRINERKIRSAQRKVSNLSNDIIHIPNRIVRKIMGVQRYERLKSWLKRRLRH